MLEGMLIGILIVILVALFVVSGMKKKKFNAEMQTMRSELKKGDKVMTDSGVVGVVTDSYEEEGYKYFVLSSGKGANSGFLTVHANAIYYVYGKESNEAEKKVVVSIKKPENAEKAETKDKK